MDDYASIRAANDSLHDQYFSLSHVFHEEQMTRVVVPFASQHSHDSIKKLSKRTASEIPLFAARLVVEDVTSFSYDDPARIDVYTLDKASVSSGPLSVKLQANEDLVLKMVVACVNVRLELSNVQIGHTRITRFLGLVEIEGRGNLHVDWEQLSAWRP